ncbi:RagB/SusD family nutrient uptake outer membrane protein [Parapedobacter deserti]|uniref:RagB/SusD family nutrient uptake outer membrane protein n=1 Tax=Parapedobacter deserti TaxID=1912957 RepID=A0ABV7JTJ0_9SPHI
MKSKYSLLGVYAIIALLASSCEKILVEEPRNSTYLDAFWQSSRDVRSGLAGNYALLRNAVTSGNFNGAGRHYMYGDAVARNYFTIDYSGDGLEGIQGGDFTFQYNIESYGDWTSFYKAIAMSNIILKQVPEIDDALLADEENTVRFKNEVIGQALFIRALSYFLMVRVWGDVPLVTEAYDDPISAPQLPRTAKEEVMAQIENDCHEAARLLSWGYRNIAEAKVMANRGSVYALLAHLYLWRATTSDLGSDQPNMNDVYSADTTIQALKDFGGYRQTDTSNYYSTFIGRSPDGIFELAASEDNREGSNRHIASFFLRKQYIDYNSPTYSRFHVNPAYLANHFYKLAKEWGWVWSGTEWEWLEYDTKVIDTADIRFRRNFTDINTNQPTCIKYSNVVYRNPGQLQDAYLSNNIIVFRYSDMLLLEAEIALYRDEVDKARTIINTFRTRNGASPSGLVKAGLTKNEVMYEYMLERGKELYLEGHLFFDLIRTRQYPQFVDWLSTDRFRQGGFYWPAAPQLFRNNLQLTQTPYWRGKV